MQDRLSDKVMLNASNLLRDAKFLSDHSRFKSAFALGVLSLEEVCKVIIGLWYGDNSHTKLRKEAHLKKQIAVSSLITAGAVMEHISAKHKEADSFEEVMESVGQFLHHCEHFRFGSYVKAGALETIKRLARYADRRHVLDVDGAEFGIGDAQMIFEKIRKSVYLMYDDRARRAGKVMFEVATRK